MNSAESFPAGTSPLSRRRLLSSMGMGLGGIALAEMLAGGAEAKAAVAGPSGAMQAFDMPPRAKRVIYLFQSGGPSQPTACGAGSGSPACREIRVRSLCRDRRLGLRSMGNRALL